MIGSLKRIKRNMDDLRAGETMLFVPLTTPLTSTSWDGDSYSTTAKTLIDLSAVFSAPAYIKAILTHVTVNDSGSAGVTSFQGIALAPNNTAGSGLKFPCNARTNDAKASHIGVIPCDANGDVYYQTVASGASTLDITIEIWGYWI